MAGTKPRKGSAAINSGDRDVDLRGMKQVTADS
jgi:hypothetical protein